jgi:hypothetical protein
MRGTHSTGLTEKLSITTPNITFQVTHHSPASWCSNGQFDGIYPPSASNGENKRVCRCLYKGDTLARVHQLRDAPERGYRHLYEISTTKPFVFRSVDVFNGAIKSRRTKALRGAATDAGSEECRRRRVPLNNLLGSPRRAGPPGSAVPRIQLEAGLAEPASRAGIPEPLDHHGIHDPGFPAKPYSAYLPA